MTTDEEGYTLWTVKWTPSAWCVPYSRIRYPFDLGVYDPTAFSDASLTLTYNQGDYSFGKGYIDPTWTVALNGKPPDEWRSIGTLSGPVINPEIWPTSGQQQRRRTVRRAGARDALIDGENNVWLRQHDFCPTESLEDSACTCVEIHTVQLRARVNLGVRRVSPATRHAQRLARPAQRLRNPHQVHRAGVNHDRQRRDLPGLLLR